jgi:hypothetical protein
MNGMGGYWKKEEEKIVRGEGWIRRGMRRSIGMRWKRRGEEEEGI